MISEELKAIIRDKILHVVDAVRKFCERHPIIAGIGGVAVVAIGTAAVANSNSSGSGSSGNGESDYSSSDLSDDYSSPTDEVDYSDSSSPRDYPDERSSPREHDVAGYDRQQNGKTVHVNPHKRGGKHNDDQS